MAGQSSNLRVSSSRRSRRMEIERQLDAAKRQRSSQLNATVAHPNGAAAVPVVPLHYAAGGHAMHMTVTFPMAGVNGAALHWSTAVTSGAAVTAAAALPLPAIAGVNGPAGAVAPLVVGPMLTGPPAAPAVGLPLVVTLDRIRNNALGAVLSALMLSCDPPMGQCRQGWTGAPPPWWPTAAEDWWVPEVVAHLNTMRAHTPVPFAPAYKLKKVYKVAVLVAVVKHLSPDFDGISEKVEVSQYAKAKLTAEEKNLWKSAIENEAARHRWKSRSVPMVPVFNFVLQQQQQAPPPQGEGHRLSPIGGATTENVVRGGSGGGVAAADGRERQVVNLAGASVTAPAGDGDQAVAAAEPEQHGDGAQSDAMVAADGGSEKPVDIPGDDGAPLGGGDVHQVASEPEQQCLIHVSTDMDQVLDDMLAPYQMQQGGEAHQAVDVEVPGAEEAVEVAPEGRPWYDRIFEDFGVPEVTPHSYYY